MEYKLICKGKIAVDPQGKDIPSRIVRIYRAGPGGPMGNALLSDLIEIKRISGGDKAGEFSVRVSETKGGDEGGGIMGDIIDKYAKEHLKVSRYPYVNYDPIYDCDVYRMGYDSLLWIWTKYLEEASPEKLEISPAQRDARSENMKKAREVRLERRKHLKNHFN